MSSERLTENDVDILKILRMIRKRAYECGGMADYYSERGLSGDSILATVYRARKNELEELLGEIIQLYAKQIEEELKK